MGIKANKDGEFTFTLPKAGFWGFCALGVGSDKEYKGKELSQDAVIWVEAKEMK
jgi:cobalt/nickel transport protein